MKNILQNKNCFITGASGTLGKILSKKLAKKGCNIFITDIHHNELASLSEELKESFRKVNIAFAECDLEIPEDIERVISIGRASLGSFDILINCAAIFENRSLAESKIEFYDKSFKINVKAPFILSRELSKDMINKNWGRIVNIGSVASFEGFSDSSVYCSTKHALLGLSRSLFLELKDKNVRVFLIAPHTMSSSMGRIVVEQTKEKMSDLIDPQEVADFIIYAISFDDQLISEELRLNRLSFKK